MDYHCLHESTLYISANAFCCVLSWISCPMKEAGKTAAGSEDSFGYNAAAPEEGWSEGSPR